MAGKDMSAQRMTMIRFGLGLGLLIYFLFNVYLEDTNKLYKDISAEVKSSKLLMGEERWQDVTRRTEKTFNYFFVELNFTGYLNKWLLPEDDKTKPARGMNLAANKFMSPNYNAARNVPLMAYQAIYRWYLLVGWFFTFLPLMIALALDGYYQWKMKRFVFGDVTIQLYRLWFRSLSIISVLIVAYLVIPNLNLFNGLTQYFPPLALALLAIAINRLLAHYQKLM
ncbi:DUF4400 domain-containing protein [Klebsiella pneumoniae]